MEGIFFEVKAVKTNRPEMKPMDNPPYLKTDNHSCPECHGKSVGSWGYQWRCRDCGKRWVKHLRGKLK